MLWLLILLGVIMFECLFVHFVWKKMYCVRDNMKGLWMHGCEKILFFLYFGSIGFSYPAHALIKQKKEQLSLPYLVWSVLFVHKYDKF